MLTKILGAAPLAEKLANLAIIGLCGTHYFSSPFIRITFGVDNVSFKCCTATPA